MRRPIALTLMSLIAVTLAAQPTEKEGLGQLEVSVTEQYKAQVKDASKLTERPSYTDSTTQKLPVRYSIISRPIEVSFQPEQLSPARIAKVEVPELYNGLVRAGFGLYNTPYVDGYYNSGRSSQHSYGFYGRHFSTKGGVRNILYEDNALSLNRLGGYFNRFYRQYTIHAEAEANWDKFSYYGLPNLSGVKEDTALGEAPYNWYRSYTFAAQLKQAQEKDLGWLKELGLRYTNFSDNYRSAENDFQLNSDWQLPAGEYALNLAANAAYFQTGYDSLYTGSDSLNTYQQGTFQLQLRPHMSIVHNDVIFDFGINLYNLSQNDDRSSGVEGKLYFFPELTVSYNFVPDVLSVFGGIKGSLQRNTYRQLTAETPYLLPGQNHLPTRVTDLFVGLNGKFSSTTTFSLQGGFKQSDGQALVYRDPFYYLDSTGYGLSLRYARLNSFYARGEVSTNIKDNLLVSASALLRSLEVNGGERAWHLPAFKGHLSAEYTLQEKIKLGTAMDFIGPRQAFDQLRNGAIEGTLPGYVDIHFNAEYIYNSRISAFVKLSNLLNSQYDMYLGYRAQSINFLMGFAYRF